MGNSMWFPMLHSAYILSGNSKHIFQTWWKSIQLFSHDMATIRQKLDVIYLYEKLLIFMLCFVYSELCNSCLQLKWKERGIPLFAQHFSAFRAMLTSFQYSPKNQLAGYFQSQELLDSFFEFLAIEIWNVFNWCVLQPQTHPLYLL